MKDLSKSKNYQNARVMSEREKLPAGAYALKIIDVKAIHKDQYDSTQYALAFDIETGEYKGFFKKAYDADTSEDKKWKGTYRFWEPKDDGTERDGWTMNTLKSIVAAFESSNTGYRWNWDEKTLKGKIVGGVFNEKEYEFKGHHGFFTNCHHLISVEDIATAKIPEPTLLKDKSKPVTDADDFVNIPDGIEGEELPF